LRLAERMNVVGIKDCSADAAQSGDLLRLRPPDFAVLTGEDALYYGALAQGADGGVLASAHIDPAAFAGVRDAVLAGDSDGARARWNGLVDLVRLLFAEPNPAPIKHWLWRMGLTASPELRLPMTGITLPASSTVCCGRAAPRHGHEMLRPRPYRRSDAVGI
jgi:4-hydroxy-tetrahydrodipicolinate synthase